MIYELKTFITDSYVVNYIEFVYSYRKHHKSRNDLLTACYHSLSEKSLQTLESIGIKTQQIKKIVKKTNALQRLDSAFGKLDVILQSNEPFILHDCDMYFLKPFDFDLLSDDNVYVAKDVKTRFNSGFIKFNNELDKIKVKITDNLNIKTEYADQDILNLAIDNYIILPFEFVRSYPFFSMTKYLLSKTTLLHYIGIDKNIAEFRKKFAV